MQCADAPAAQSSRAWPRVIGEAARMSWFQGRVQGWWQWAPLRLLAGSGRGRLSGALERSDPEPDPADQRALGPELELCQCRAGRALPGQCGPSHPRGLRTPVLQNPSACVDKPMVDYLVDLITPPERRVCPSDTSPSTRTSAKPRFPGWARRHGAMPVLRALGAQSSSSQVWPTSFWPKLWWAPPRPAESPLPVEVDGGVQDVVGPKVIFL